MSASEDLKKTLAEATAGHETLLGKYDQLATDHQQLQGQNEQLAAGQQQLQGQHDQLSAAHQELAQQHQEAVGALTTTQQQLKQTETLKQKAEARIEELVAQIEAIPKEIGAASGSSPGADAEVARLTQLLTEAQQKYETEAAKVKAFEDSPIGKATWPMRSRVISWALAAVLGSVGGAAAGVYSPINPAKKQLSTTLSGQTRQQQTLATTATELATTKQELDKARQDLAALQQSNGPLATQVSSLTTALQSASRQLSEAQAQVNASKAELTKEHAALLDTQQEVVAEKSRSQQLATRANQASNLQTIIDKHPYLAYKGQKQGTIRISFEGKNEKPANISISQTTASWDSNIKDVVISGLPLPNVPISIEPGGGNVAIISSPNPTGNWQKMTVSVWGKGTHLAVLNWSVF